MSTQKHAGGRPPGIPNAAPVAWLDHLRTWGEASAPGGIGTNWQRVNVDSVTKLTALGGKAKLAGWWNRRTPGPGRQPVTLTAEEFRSVAGILAHWYAYLLPY